MRLPISIAFAGRVLALLLPICTAFPVPARAQSTDTDPSQPPSTRASRLPRAPVMDGVVFTDEAWRDSAPLTQFWQTLPNAGDPSSERTEVRIGYTGDALYIGVVLFDRDPGGLTVADSRRDSPLDDVDSFRIMLDTFRDRQNGFVFATTPAALEYDGQVIGEGAINLGGGAGGSGGRQQGGSGGGFNINWDGAWRVRTATFEEGWSAEFEIPFRTLRYEPGENRTWGLNLQRSIRRRREQAYWSPLPFQFDLMRVSLAGTLTGLTLPVQRNLRVMPYALGEARGRPESADTPLLGNAGVDVKYALTPGLALDGTVRTDFAQVEVDEQQVNLDRFNLFFPEKRPFFLENAGLFTVGSASEAEIFFSRRIGITGDGQAIPIIAGGRLSGRAGPVNVGLLNMQTQASGATPANNFSVARVRRDFRGRSNVGFMVVDRHATGSLAGTGDHNQSFAADGRWGLGRTGLISGFMARTATPGATRGQHAYQLQIRNDTQPLTLSADYTETGEDFNPEVGFLSRVGGFRKIQGTMFSRLRPKSLPKFLEIRPHSTWRAYYDHSGFQQTGYWHIDSHWELRSSYEFHTGMNLTREGVVAAFPIYPGVIVPAGTYKHTEAQLVLQTNPGAPVFGRVQFTGGGFFGGNRIGFSNSVRVRSGERLSAEVNWDRNDVDLPGGQFVTNLTRSRVSYSFTPKVFAQALLQYNDRAGLWTSNFRFGWLQQANMGLFVVYTDAHPLDGRELVPTMTNRSVIVKLSRMFDVLD